MDNIIFDNKLGLDIIRDFHIITSNIDFHNSNGK